MDEHIQRAAASTPAPAAATPAAVFKPSVCYDDFYQTQMTTAAMTTEIGNIIEKYEKTPGAMSNQTADELTEEIMDKIKKTYKNRYYKYISSMRRSSDGGNGDDDNDNEDTSN
jgi:Skp family chaperone for outer membrane proteins